MQKMHAIYTNGLTFGTDARIGLLVKDNDENEESEGKPLMVQSGVVDAEEAKKEDKQVINQIQIFFHFSIDYFLWLKENLSIKDYQLMQ